MLLSEKKEAPGLRRLDSGSEPGGFEGGSHKGFSLCGRPGLPGYRTMTAFPPISRTSACHESASNFRRPLPSLLSGLPCIPYTESLRILPAVNAGVLEAAIFIFSPVRGFLPSLAACSRT